MRLIAILFAAVISTPVYADNTDSEWAVFGGDAAAHRHVNHSLITPSNINQLHAQWQFDTGISATFQATPIVQDGVMYVSLPFNDVVALNAVTGKQLWRYQHDRNKAYPMCCGPANRGVAVADGKVFMGTVDARLIALDAKTGNKLWDIDVVKGDAGIQEDVATLSDQRGAKASGASGAGLNMAPMVFNGKVIVGITGVGYGLHLESPNPDAPLGAVVGIAGNYGRRGFLAAYDVNTGKRDWKFDTIPEQGWEGQFVQTTPDGVKLPRDIEQEKAALAKHRDAWQYGGGSAWSTPVIDAKTNTLYFGTGNPSPQMEGSSRPGDNLYSSSLVALDTETGKVKWYFQQVPHDMWGYDVASPPVLFDTHINGKTIPAVGQAGKTGWFYVLNRHTGKLLFKSEAFVPQKNMFSAPTEAGVEIYPGVLGGANWSPVSLDDSRRLVFIAGIHWPISYTLHNLKATDSQPALQYSSMSPRYEVPRYGLLSAINIDTGKLVWQHKTANPLIGGVLSTDSGVVFTGSGDSKLMAFSASDGKLLWTGDADAGVNAPPISYRVGNKQYIAVVTGGNKLFGYKSGQQIKVWALAN